MAWRWSVCCTVEVACGAFRLAEIGQRRLEPDLVADLAGDGDAASTTHTAVRNLAAYRSIAVMCWPTPPKWAAIVQAMVD